MVEHSVRGSASITLAREHSSGQSGGASKMHDKYEQ